MREIRFPITPDLKLVAERDYFKQIEEQHFQTASDQEEAHRLYDEMVYSESSMSIVAMIRSTGYEGKPILLPMGTIVYRGGQFQVIHEPYQVRLQSVDYGWAASKPLPDGSVVYFPASLLS